MVLPPDETSKVPGCYGMWRVIKIENMTWSVEQYRNFPNISRTCIFLLLTLSLPLFYSSLVLFSSTLLLFSSLLCFSSLNINIVSSLTSKLSTMMIFTSISSLSHTLLIDFIGKSLPSAYHGVPSCQFKHPRCLEDKRGHTPQGLPTWHRRSLAKRWDILPEL